MLLLGAILALYYLPRPQKPFHLNRNYRFETAEELAPRMPQINTSEICKSQIDYRIPDKYNEDQICLMVRDPEWLFAFWEISTTTHMNLTSKYGANFFSETKHVIRVYNLSEAENSTSYYDINISEELTRWHFNVEKPNNKFYIAIGRLKANGDFIPIFISNSVHMPRTCVSSVLDKNWLPYFDKQLYGNDQLYKNDHPFSSFTIFQERKD